jgi:hypothetical protein
MYPEISRYAIPSTSVSAWLSVASKNRSGHLETQVTVDDPTAYTKPIVYTIKSTLRSDEDLLEYFCADNEKDVQHFQ